MKPTLPIKFLQSLHGQLSNFHLQISFLNSVNVSIFLTLNGIIFQITGPKYLNEFLPQFSVLTLGTLKSHPDLKLYISSSIFTKMLLKQFADKPCLILYISMAIV